MRHQSATKRKRARATSLVHPGIVTSLNPMRVRLHGATSDSKALPVDPYSRTARPGDMVAVTRLGSLLLVIGSPSPQIAADGTDQSATIDALLGYTGIARLPVGPAVINSRIIVPDGADIRGFGGGAGTQQSTLLCGTADAGVTFEGGGGLSCGFGVDGATIATAPLIRQGGSNGVGRKFSSVHVQRSAEDNVLCIEAQNDAWDLLVSILPGRDSVVLDHGYGGTLFSKCEFAEGARYNLRVSTNFAVGDPYGVPTDNLWDHCIFEYTGADTVSVAYINGGARLHFESCSFYASTAPSGPMVDIDNFAIQILFSGDTLIQNTDGSSGIPSGSKGIQVAPDCLVLLRDLVQIENTDHQLWLTGDQANIDTTGAYIYGNANHRYGADGTTTPSTWIINNQTEPSVIRRETYADVVRISEKDDRSGMFFTEYANGSQVQGDGSDYAGDLTIGRIGGAAWGLGSFNTGMGIGGWSTRPAFKIPIGTQVIGVNYTTGTLDIATGNGTASDVTWYSVPLTAG